MDQTQDIELLNLISRQDMAAMERFYRKHENSVYRFALKKLQNEAEASDIVNTVMLEVWNTAARFESRSKVSTWLFGIAHHRIIDLIRKKKSNHSDIEEHAELESQEPHLGKDIQDGQVKKFIVGCMQTLSADQQQVMQLIFFNDASYEDISQIMSIAVGTIKSRVFHAKSSLKKCLSKHLGADAMPGGAI